MTAKLLDHRYGKSHVRVLKVLRDGPTQTVKELDVSVGLAGDFETSYTAGDNHLVVATDTMKNTVNVLAHEHLGAETERFAITLARHFLEKYPQVQTVSVQAVERVWDRLEIGGTPHPHSFAQTGSARPFARVELSRSSQTLKSGIEDLLILKSTGSGFEGYPRDEFTTLPETHERIFATALTATWTWCAEPENYVRANAALLAAMLKPFGEKYSPSVQTTLFEMGGAALEACAGISKIHLSMPNQHCLLIDLKRFGIENRHELFVPTTEPHGQIEATVTRGQA